MSKKTPSQLSKEQSSTKQPPTDQPSTEQQSDEQPAPTNLQTSNEVAKNNLLTSKYTLIGVKVAVVAGILALISTIIDQSWQLDAVAPRPLEGIWKYSVKYDKFHYEDYTIDDSIEKRMVGRAAFVWDHRPGVTKYNVLIVGSVEFTQKTEPSILTTASECSLIATEGGDLLNAYRLEGEYIARTSNDQNYKSPSERKFGYDGLRVIKNPSGYIYKIQYDFSTKKSKGTITFERK